MRALPLAHMRSCPAATTRSIASDIAGRLGQVLVCFLAVLLLVFAFPQQALAESAACTALNSDFGNGATITISPPIGSADSRDEGYGAAYGDAEDFEVGETITWSASSSNSGNENIYFTLGSNANTLVYFDNAGGTEFNESGSFQLNDSVDGVILTVYGSVDNTGQNPPSSLDFSIRCDGVAPPVPEPTITSVVPDQGPEAGGTTVIITGTDLTGATSATFGGTPATSYTVDSDTQITATTPPGTAGAVDAVVTTPGGSATLVRGFTYT
ncbi:IPT/TIG domain-containing protein, partial [Aquamicrobium sp. LC103]|uniref:IPT/TIG domain-containing protein n=1 Tax=Aquamicrobium sp. LC103 TaxID=1120658 RepID=UPI0011385ED6